MSFDYQSKRTVSYSDLAKQAKARSKNPGLQTRGGASDFFIFKICEEDNTEEKHVEMLTDLNPEFEGDILPDIAMAINLVHFNLSNKEELNKRTRATMRLTIEQKDPLFQQQEPLMWIASVGLKIFDIVKNKKSLKDVNLADFNGAFGNRPIEIPKGRATLSFDLIKHREPKWWQKVFNFTNSPEGHALSAALGFPGVTQNVVGMMDRLFKDITKSRSEVIFNSEKIDLAFTNAAKGEDSFEETAVMNRGYYLVCKGSDLGFFMSTPAKFNKAVNNLIPRDIGMEEFLSEGFVNPFDSKTFAIFKVALANMTIDKTLLFATSNNDVLVEA